MTDEERKDETIHKLEQAVIGLLSEWDKLTRYGSPMAKAANEHVNYARSVLRERNLA